MNYIILNGKKSNQIDGLMIQSLPDISKPLIRTEIEEIDGKDGDIVTNLGYSAYDRELSIGLFGNFNINDVIRYFDSSGEVIFSNEPDKVYRYQIIEQIDFERLVRFRTATVVFHCQPFKYSAVGNGRDLKITNQIFNMKSYFNTVNDVSIIANENTVELMGTASANTELYIPIDNIYCEAGQYLIKAYTSGTQDDVLKIGIIDTMPSASKTLTGNLISVNADASIVSKGNQGSDILCNYLYVYIPNGTELSCDLTVTVQKWFAIIYNMGNTISHPTLTLKGEGNITLMVNSKPIFVIDLNVYHAITIDVDKMEAYLGDVLLNRYISGDYDNLMLNAGKNIISWDGDVQEIEISDYTRWI